MGEGKRIEVKKDKGGKEQRSRELTIKRENPFSLFQKMDQYFNDLTRGFFNDWYWPFRFMRSKPLSLSIMESEPFFRTPLANVIEDDEIFKIVTEMPGLDKGGKERRERRGPSKKGIPKF